MRPVTRCIKTILEVDTYTHAPPSPFYLSLTPSMRMHTHPSISINLLLNFTMSDININHPLPTHEVVTYKECLHNHSAALDHVTYDGCVKYIAGEDALLCACCGCHRNFHHKNTIFTAEPQTQTPDQVQEMRSKRKKRTTFSSEHKNKLIRFAESVGWKPRKEKKDEIESFCSEMGITRRMFVVWLSNNRHQAINDA